MIRVIRIITEILGWLAIASSPTLISGIIGLLAYMKWENKFVTFSIVVIGFIIGAIWATKISMKYGTIEFLSKIRSSS